MKKTYFIASVSLDDFIELEKKANSVPDPLDREAYASFEESETDDRPYQVVNGIALYSIQGKMMASGNWFTKMLGIPTYDRIADDLARISQDEEVEKVLINMGTPGGHVAGISDVSESWKRLNAVKPITVHTPSMVASAGMWLASNSDKIYASEVAEVGSIGAVMQHISYQKQLEKDGIKVTEIKSAPLKHVGSPAKDLTEEERAHLQAQIMDADALFKKQLYTTRPQILPDAFTGATFSASESVRLGLIDGVKTYTEVFEELSAPADGHSNPYTEEYTMKRKVTQAMATAAIEAGADPKTLQVVTQEEYDALPEAEKNMSIEEEAELTDEDTLDTEASAEDDNAPELAAAAERIEALETELATAQALNETLKEQVEDLESKVKASNTEPLRVFAEERLAVMRTALGLTKVDMSEFSTASLVTELTAVDKQFKKAFKPGGHVPLKAENAGAEGSKTGKIVTLHSDRALDDATGF